MKKSLLLFWKKYAFVVLLAFMAVGLFDFRFALAAVICMAGPVITAIFKGRFWCGNLCPRGNFYDRVVSKWSRKKKVPDILKSKAFRAGILIIMFLMFGIGIYKNWGDLNGIGLVFYRMIVITTLVGMVLAPFYNERTWCHFCPIGTLASCTARLRKSKSVLQVSSACVSCKLCEKKCPIGIVPYEYKGNLLSHPDCIQCGACAAVCHINAIGYEKAAG